MTSGDELPQQTTDATTSTGANGIRNFTFAALTAVFIALCVVLAVPFLSAISWGVALAIIALPLHRWLERHLKSPTLAAVISTAVVAGVILGTGAFVVYQLGREAAAAVGRAQVAMGETGIREKMDEHPSLSKVTAWMDRVGLDTENEIRKVVGQYAQGMSSLASGSFESAAQFMAAAFILFYVLRDRNKFIDGVRGLLPLAKSETDHVLKNAADSVHANLYATSITSIIDASSMGLLFWWIGLPAAVLWASVMFVLSFLPVVGAGFVWIPAAVYLVMTGKMLSGLAVLALGVVLFFIVDNFGYARLAGQRMKMHEVPALLSFFGGLAIFGMSGMVLGPAILAVTLAFLDVWKRRLAGERVPSGVVLTSDTVSN